MTMFPPGEYYEDAEVVNIEFSGLDDFTDPLGIHLELEISRPETAVPLPYLS